MNVKEIGNRIKLRRTALQMTQKDLANAMSVSNQLISKWETGESVPSLEYLDSLCKALDVDYSYFTSDGDAGTEHSEAIPIAKPEKQRKRKFNWKWFALVLSALWVAAFVCGFILLTYYVFVPAASRMRYLEEIEKAYENYFALGYYSINEKSELDGDVKDDYRYDGYFDESGAPVFYDTKSKNTVKGGIMTHDGGEYKYHYVPDKTYETLEDLALARIVPDDDELGLWDDNTLDKISYIRKVKGGYYLEFKDEYFTDELSGTQKKNFKLTEKIKGKIEIKDGLCNYMEVTVKYFNKPDNEHFTIKASFEFIAEKPVIGHSNLGNREWNGTYVGDKWYPSERPDIPVMDTTPKCEELLSAEDFVSRLSGGKASSLARNFDFNAIVFQGGIKDGGDCFYYVDGSKVVILNKTDLSKKTTVSLNSLHGKVTNVYVYNGNVYWTDCNVTISSELRYFRVKNIASGNTDALFSYDSSEENDITYNGGYAIYYGYKPDTYTKAYNVINLDKKKVIYSYTDIINPILDSSGNVYGKEKIDEDYVPVVYKSGSRIRLKGKDYFRVNEGFDENIYVDGDSICTYENDTVYLYEKGVLKETLTSSDPRFKKNYIKLSSGYCITGTTSASIFDENGEERKFGKFKLKDENGEWKTVDDYSSKEIYAVVNGKLIVSTDYFGGYLAVYDETDLTKPLYYMKKPADYNHYCAYDEFEIVNLGSKTIIAVRINTVDYYGYDLYYF